MWMVRSASRRPAPRFTSRLRLRSMVVHMISTNSLAAFTAEVSRIPGVTPARGPGSPAQASGSSTEPAQRRLEALPPKPEAPLPRGSLLDLRV